MASDMFEIGDVLVCVDDSPHGGWAGDVGTPLKKNQAYEVERHGIGTECYLVGVPYKAWKQSRFRRATLSEIRMYRKKQGFEKHQFAVGDLVVCLVNDSLRSLSIGRTCVVSATKSDYEHEGFVDIDGGENPGQHFAAYFRKATPAETAAYRRANGGPPFKAVRAPKNYSPVDSIGSVEVGDTIVFTGRSDKKGPKYKYGAVAIVQGVIYGSWDEVHELRILVPGEGWTYVTRHFWVPVGKGYELVAQGQPIETGDEWFEPAAPKGWYPTSFRTEEKYTKTTDNILRRKVKEKATVVGVAGCDIKPGQLVTVQIGDKPPFKAEDVTPPAPGTAFPKPLPSDGELPTITVKYEWDGTVKPKRVGKMPVVPGNPAENTEESLNRAISFPKDFLLRSDDGREFEVIDWKPNVTMDEAVTVEAKLMVFQDPVKKPKATPFKMGDLVVCADSTDQHVAPADRIAQGRTYRIEGIDSCGFLRIGGMQGRWAPSRFRLATPAEAQAFLDAERRLPSDPGSGYRFLDKAELVVEGDEFWCPSFKAWTASGRWRFEGSERMQCNGMTYRRRNQFAEGELVQIIKPATQVLRDEYPGWATRGSGNMNGLDGKVLECPPSLTLGQGKRVISVERGRWWTIDVDWLAPASSKQKEAFQAEKDKKAKVQELEDKMKAIESELAILKGA